MKYAEYLIPFCAAGVLASCGLSPVVSQANLQAVVTKNYAWKSTPSVCFMNRRDVDGEMLLNLVGRTPELFSRVNIRLDWFRDCDESDYSKSSIRVFFMVVPDNSEKWEEGIAIVGDRGVNSGLGVQKTVYPKLLNVSVRNGKVDLGKATVAVYVPKSVPADFQKGILLRTLFLHEVSHAMGLYDQQNHSQSTCDAPKSKNDDQLQMGSGSPESVMNDCGRNWVLGESDYEGLRYLYPSGFNIAAPACSTPRRLMVLHKVSPSSPLSFSRDAFDIYQRSKGKGGIEIHEVCDFKGACTKHPKVRLFVSGNPVGEPASKFSFTKTEKGEVDVMFDKPYDKVEASAWFCDENNKRPGSLPLYADATNAPDATSCYGLFGHGYIWVNYMESGVKKSAMISATNYGMLFAENGDFKKAQLFTEEIGNVGEFLFSRVYTGTQRFQKWSVTCKSQSLAEATVEENGQLVGTATFARY